jgi:hypothetical protein
MNRPVFFDLDGVLRSLTLSTFGYEPPEYHHINPSGEDLVSICDCFPEESLFKAPATEYLPAALDMFGKELFILTAQYPHWIPFTERWIEHNIGKCTVLNIRAGKKIGFIKKVNGVLVEDSPLFSNYENVILVDRPYNRIINPGDCMAVIHTPEDLRRVLRDGYL